MPDQLSFRSSSIGGEGRGGREGGKGRERYKKRQSIGSTINEGLVHVVMYLGEYVGRAKYKQDDFCPISLVIGRFTLLVILHSGTMSVVCTHHVRGINNHSLYFSPVPRPPHSFRLGMRLVCTMVNRCTSTWEKLSKKVPACVRCTLVGVWAC